MEPPAIDVRGIRKTYPAADGGPPAEALRGVDLRVEHGELLCVLGPNGAGKTTLIAILCGLLDPDAGSGRLAGLDLAREGRTIRAMVNFASGHANLPDIFSTDEMLHYFGRLYGLPKKERERKADELTEFFELRHYRDVPFNRLSTGLKQRVALAKSLVNDPRILFLDEPTVGVDPQASLLIRSRLRQWHAQRRATILLTTHQMDEAEEMSDRVAFLREGLLVRLGDAAELKRSIRFQERIALRGRNMQGLAAALAQLPGVSHIATVGDEVCCRVDCREKRLTAVLQAALATAAVIEDVYTSRPTLGDVFVALADGSDPDERVLL
jgi:ABC-2 type transport system ATP-binding protein